MLLITAAAACHGRSPAPPASPSPTGLELTSSVSLVTPASSEYSEIRLAVSPDGATMIWGSTNRPGGPGGWDLWMSHRAGDGWTAPAPVPVDTAANEFDPAFSPDGGRLYFFSNRAGGLGGDDLYRVAVTDAGFGPVEHLDGNVNSAGDEWAPTPTADGGLLFATDGRGGAGRHDLFVAPAAGDGFGPATPLPGAINTAADEFDAALIADQGIVFARSTDVERDPIDLVYAARGPAGYDVGAPLPATINVAGGYTLGPSLDATDPGVLYFSGQRPEVSAGTMDLYRVRFRPAVPTPQKPSSLPP